MLGDGPARNFGAPMPLPVDPVPTSPSASADLIALSLTPFRWRRTLGERLRGGERPATILNRLLADPRLNKEGLDRRTLLSRVASAEARAAAGGLHLVPWDDASY